jgi:alpha-galactosidase
MLILKLIMEASKVANLGTPTKIVCIGAGSYSFGLTTLVSLLRSNALKGSEIVLVDRDEAHLATMYKLITWLNEVWEAGMHVDVFNHHQDALAGAQFVINATEVGPREGLWESDYRIPLKYGVRQPYAENSGPGGFAHAARNVLPVLEIARAMESDCPDAWLINFTNPMQRICAAVHRHSAIKVIGLCHQLSAGYAMVGKALAQELDIMVPPSFTSTHASEKYIVGMFATYLQAIEKVKITAAGVNHFTWMLSLEDRQTGADLYPLFRECWEALPESFEPLTRRVFDAFGLFPIPGDEHLCEYLPWVSDPVTRPWDKYELELYEWTDHEQERVDKWVELERAAEAMSSPEEFVPGFSEGALEIIENIVNDGHVLWESVNIPNQGQISNLPADAIVELPGILNADGVSGISIGALPEGIAELLRREITISHLTVDAVVSGDRQLALQALLLDPVIRDMDVAKQVLDDYLTIYQAHLPTFWA